MPVFIFNRNQALEAINLSKVNGIDWLYQTYPKPDGNKRKSSTGFLVYEGNTYPVKPLGRLANAIAGQPMKDNPITNHFRTYFQKLGFQLIDTHQQEAEEAADRQKRQAEIWLRPRQAQFRQKVFETFGSACIISGCSTLEALEAAHIVPVASEGGDDATNGIPLRADLHRLFDSNSMIINADTWAVSFVGAAMQDYEDFYGLDLTELMSSLPHANAIQDALRKRNSMGKNFG